MKTFNYWYLSLVVLLSLGSHSCAQNKATIDLKEDEKLIEFTTDRFTLPNLHVTPDGKNIIFDVLGDIYQVPIEGGKAEVLLQDNNWKQAGKLSPDGKTLAYISDKTGEFQVWTLNLETNLKRVYPTKEYSHYPLYSYWDFKGNLLIPSAEGLLSYDVVSGNEIIIRSALENERSILDFINRTMSINKSGSHAYFQSKGDLWAFDIDKQLDILISSLPEKHQMEQHQISPNAKVALYYNTHREQAPMHSLQVFDLTTYKSHTLRNFKDLGLSTKLSYSFDFIDEQTIILDNKGEIVRMDIETGEYESIPIEVVVKKIIKKPLRREPQYIKDSIITASVLRNPVTKPDLDTIYFGAFGKLHSYTKNTEQITEVYPNEDRFEVSPNLSPDGKYLAYSTWKDWKMGHIYVRELITGKAHQITLKPGRYINPIWSPDGTEIIFIADETEAKMGINSQISTGAPKYLVYNLDIHRMRVLSAGSILEKQNTEVLRRIHPSTNVPRRFYPIPSYHPNGKSIYINTRNNEKDFPIIIEINIESKDIINEIIIPYNTDEVLVSPNAEHIAFIFDEQVWTDSYPYSTKLKFSSVSKFIPERYHYKGGSINNILLPEAKSVYEVAPSYLSWQDDHTLMWGSAEEVYTYDVRTGITAKIADIKVQRPRDIPKSRYALTNAQIITMNKQDEIIEKGTILVKDNRIEALGEVGKVTIPENYKIFNLEGKTIVPGLIDVHAHYFLEPYEIINQQNYKFIGNIAYGVTTIYDPSVNALDYREQAQMVESGQLLGPRLFASGNIILGDSGRANYDYKKIESYEDAQRLIQSINKLNVSGPIKEYAIRNKTVRNLLLESAQKSGMGVTSHQSYFKYMMSLIINGYTAIEHEIGSFYLNKDIIELIGQSGIHYTPTFMISPGIKDIYSDITFQEKEKLLKLNGKVLFHNNYGNVYNIQNTERKVTMKNWSEAGVNEHDRVSENLKRIINTGGKISVGAHGNPLPGIGTHWELWFMTKAMSNYQALQTATINGAEKLDLQEEIGSIENGKLADMVVLNADPLENIFNTTDILYTIQNGNIYEAETMKQIHPVEKELQPWGWSNPAILESMEYIYIK